MGVWPACCCWGVWGALRPPLHHLLCSRLAPPAAVPLPSPLRPAAPPPPCRPAAPPPAALNSEQKALLDFLVLARAQRFVGFGSSTFSFYLREYRALHGLRCTSSRLVDASIIGTDPLFHSAGTMV